MTRGPSRRLLDVPRRDAAARLGRVAGCGLIILAAVFAPRAAAAQSEDEAGARVLFNDGRQLIKAGRVEEACGKFEAARKLYASPGVLLNLADCHERINRTASAWTEFGDAADAAARAGRTNDESEAKRRQAALQSRLSLLAIVADQLPEAAVVRRDGKALDRSVWSTPIPVDPGVHEVTVEAPGYRAWSTKVTASDPGRTETVRVPALESTASPAAPTTPSAHSDGAAPATAKVTGESPAPPGAGQRTAGWAVGGVGVGAMVASGVLALVARAKYSSAENETVGRHDDSVTAGRLADIGTAVLAVGGAATVAGVVLLVTAPKAQISVGTTGTGILLSGTF